jgi:(2R)-sulfolactate sulfo-lyase subunit beta
MKNTFWGYKRENGRVGVRNHVIVLPVDDLSNAAAEAVANNVKGVMAIPHPYGRLQFGADLDLHFRTLIGAGCNPNVAAVVVIGIEDGWTKKVVDGIATTGKPVSGLRHRRATATTRRSCGRRRPRASTCSGRPRSIASSATSRTCGCRPSAASRTRRRAAARTRRSATRSTSSTPAGCTLVFGETTELTGGEQIVAARCRDDKVRADFMRVFDRYQKIIERHKTSDLSDSQPTKGNIAGGLTTIEEKALGNIQKIGRKCVVDGVLDKAEMPTHKGLWFMDSSSAAAEMVTLCAASGLRRAFLPDRAGQRDRQPDPAGHQDLREPAHRAPDERARRRRHVGAPPAGDHDGPAGDKLIDMMFRTANGRYTAAEALGHREFVLTRLYESA